MMYEGLVRIYDNKIEPAMAESWKVSKDGLTYTFKLRDSKWSDGEPVTAYDFEYGIKRLLDQVTRRQTETMPGWDTISKMDRSSTKEKCQQMK